MNLGHTPKLIAADNLAHLANRRIKTARMRNHELDATFPAAAIIRSQSSSVKAMGFSTITCLPRSSAVMACSA